MPTLQSRDARTGEPLGNPIPETTSEQVDAIATAAGQAFETWSGSTSNARHALLSGLAAALEHDRKALVELADQETALGQARLNGELDRTAFQLRRFADLALQRIPFARVDDPEILGAPPSGHPHMVRQQVPLGPVAMYSASNFPFAFSVLGGDTASALAAGCPVVVKAHMGHLLLSQRVFALAKAVLAQLGLQEGLIGMVRGRSAGVQLIQHPSIAAGAFTGSISGGTALQAAANVRPRPIPFYGELGSINPVVALPKAVAANGTALASALASSITQGTGQFCTSPGLIIVIDSPENREANDSFVASIRDLLSHQPTHAMLTAAMRKSFDKGVENWKQHGAKLLLTTSTVDGAPRPVLAEVAASDFVTSRELHEEVFGPASLVVRASSVDEVLQVLSTVGGSLTVTVWGAETETQGIRRMVRVAMSIAGRVLFKGVPTGVAVTAAQQHGGPWPSSTQPMSTSVGDAALARFLRPIALQDAPSWLLAMSGKPL